MRHRAAPFAVCVLIWLAAARSVAAQTSTDEDWKIIDNSFLVEEAFNQDPHVVQNIFTFQRLTVRDWQFTFTQEWPVPRTRHQLSYTIPVQALDGTSGMGDVLINYRLQVLEEGDGHPAFSPRISAILPTGRVAAGAGTHGVQVNLPFSKHRGDFYFHWNGGFTWQRTAGDASLFSPSAAGSIIYRARQMLNLMLEGVIVDAAGTVTPVDPNASLATSHATASTISPGVRGGWNVGDDKQIVLGIAAPVTRTQGDTSTALFLYFSYEGPVKGLPRK
ncbi:MAG TPA: transporter [Vicinamibacterales bacterium]